MDHTEKCASHKKITNSYGSFYLPCNCITEGETATMAYAKELAFFIVKRTDYPIIREITVQTDWTSSGFISEDGSAEGYETTELIKDEDEIIAILAKKIYEFQP